MNIQDDEEDQEPSRGLNLVFPVPKMYTGWRNLLTLLSLFIVQH